MARVLLAETSRQPVTQSTIFLLGAARTALRNMKDVDGKTLINVTPKFLVVGTALETIASNSSTTLRRSI